MRRLLLLALAACDQGAPTVATDQHEVPARDDAAVVAALDAGPIDAGIDAPVDAAVRLGKPYRLPVNHGDTSNCLRFAVGDAREKATLCDDFGGGMWRLTNQTVRVKRGGKRVVVLDAVTKIEGFDTGINELESNVIVAADGMSAAVELVPPKRDPPPTSMRTEQPGPMGDCTGPGPTAAEEREERSTYGRPTFGEARKQLCDAIGTYRWSGDRFVKQ